MGKNIDNKRRTAYIFCGLLLINSAYFFISILYTRGAALSFEFFHDINDTFMDFYNSIYHAAIRRPYLQGGIYPALTYVIFYLFSRFLPEAYVDEILQTRGGGYAVRDTQGGKIALIIFLGITVMLLVLLLYAKIKGTPILKSLFVSSLVFSAPVMYAVERGNIILLSVVCSLVFCLYYNSDNKIKKEIGLIALAIAVSIKLYPAILGLLLIREKRYKDAIKCTIYGVGAFVIPFFFMGGVRNISSMFENIFRTSQAFVGSIGFSWKVGFENTVAIFAQICGIRLREGKILSYILMLLLVLTVIAIFFIEERWKQITALCLVMILGPSFSFIYAICFMIIPLVFFLNQQEGHTKKGTLYLLLFAMLFFYYPFGKIDFWNLNFSTPYTIGTFVPSVCLIILEFLLLMEGFQGLKRICMARKNQEFKDKGVHTRELH